MSASGAASPGAALEIFRGSGVDTDMRFWQAGIASSRIGHKASDTNLYITNTYYGEAIGYAAKSITLTNAGNAGIGLTNPAYPLDVNGIIRNSGGYLGRYGAGSYGAGIYTDAGNMILYFDNNGTSHRWDNNAVVKTFIIQHPLDKNKYLVHGTLEGPEGAVYYRGTARLKNGKAGVTLPDYFEALTREEGRSVLLTAVDGFDRLMVKKTGGSQVSGGKFLVYSDNRVSDQEFNWEVIAVRKDVPRLIVEPSKNDIEVHGDGPYTFGTARSRELSPK